MAFSKAFTTVTPFSKLITLLLFILLPFAGFYLGIEYQKSITPHYPSLQYDPSLLSKPAPKMLQQPDGTDNLAPRRLMIQEPGTVKDMPAQIPQDYPKSIPPAPPKTETICTMDAKQCPDGTWVGRTGPNCEFVCK